MHGDEFYHGVTAGPDVVPWQLRLLRFVRSKSAAPPIATRHGASALLKYQRFGSE
jgi:hypothetical protein